MKTIVKEHKNGTKSYLIRKRKYKTGSYGERTTLYKKNDSLIIAKELYSLNSDNKFEGNSKLLSIKYKNGKLSIYSFGKDELIRNVTYSTTILEKYIFGKEITEATKKRFNIVLREFLKEKKIKSKINPNLEPSKALLQINFPALQELSLWEHHSCIPPVARKYFRTSKIFKEVVYRCFGFKDEELYQIVFNISEKTKCLNILNLGAICRGLLTLSEIKELLNTNITNSYEQFLSIVSYKNSVRNIRYFLKNCVDKKYIKAILLHCLNSYEDRIIRNSFTYYAYNYKVTDLSYNNSLSLLKNFPNNLSFPDFKLHTPSKINDYINQPNEDGFYLNKFNSSLELLGFRTEKQILELKSNYTKYFLCIKNKNDSLIIIEIEDKGVHFYYPNGKGLMETKAIKYFEDLNIFSKEKENINKDNNEVNEEDPFWDE